MYPAFFEIPPGFASILQGLLVTAMPPTSCHGHPSAPAIGSGSLIIRQFQVNYVNQILRLHNLSQIAYEHQER